MATVTYVPNQTYPIALAETKISTCHNAGDVSRLTNGNVYVTMPS